MIVRDGPVQSSLVKQKPKVAARAEVAARSAARTRWMVIEVCIFRVCEVCDVLVCDNLVYL